MEDVTPLLTHWSYVFLALTHRYLAHKPKLIQVVSGLMISLCLKHQGAVSIRKTVLPGMAIPMLKIRRHNGRLIFNMEIAIRR